jgi:hypothetical protein
MRLRIPIFTLFLLATHLLSAQQLTNSDYGAYIKKYKDIAIREMQIYKIPASITLAQGMIESGCGKSVLAVDTKNHFGIKCQQDWPGDTYLYDDDKEKECFRKYNSVDESFRDHSIFLTTRKRYAALFTLEITDYKGWARGLKQAGYATNPDYPNILIRLIETNKLYLLDDTSVKTEEIAQNLPPEKAAPKEKKTAPKEKNTFTWGGRILFSKNYKMPDPSAFEILYTSDKGRKVYENHDVPFIFAQKGDTWYTIAKEFRIMIFQVYRMNDLKESDPIQPGQILYLESKKKKNSDGSYKVKKDDSMYSISQDKCIKLKFLLKYNKLKAGEEPEPGFVLKLTK